MVFGLGVTVNFAYGVLVFRNYYSRQNIALWIYTIAIQIVYGVSLYPFSREWYASAITLALICIALERVGLNTRPT